ncbi:MAG: hypothetical protein GC180_04980 [Bacteroidetes bacterium]|nr:hypothetical protein [Bacteroidota bacterium]
MIAVGVFSMLESCTKCDKHPCDAVSCDLEGTISGDPGWCATPPTSMMGITDDNGIFYQIDKDLTNSFSHFKAGEKVKFGYCAIKDMDRKGNDKSSFVAPHIKIITLACLEKVKEPDPVGDCEHDAVVIQVDYSDNTLSTMKYIKVDGKVYMGRGDLAEQLLASSPGTHYNIGYNQVIDCYIPMVVSNPMIDGCIQLTCLNNVTKLN